MSRRSPAPQGGTPAPARGPASRVSLWLVGLVIAALGGVITDSLKGTFGGLVPPIRRMTCAFEHQPKPLTVGEAQLGILVFDLYGDRTGIEADELAVALQSLGHAVARTCDRLGPGAAMTVPVGPIDEKFMFRYEEGTVVSVDPPKDPATARARIEATNATVAIYGAMLPGGRARLSVVTPIVSGGFVLDAALDDPEWPVTTGFFDKLAILPPPEDFRAVDTATLNFIHALAHEPHLAATRRVAVARTYAELVYHWAFTASSTPLYAGGYEINIVAPRGTAEPVSVSFIPAMAHAVADLAEQTSDLPVRLTALSYLQSAATNFPEFIDARRRFVALARSALQTPDLPTPYRLRITALTLCPDIKYLHGVSDKDVQDFREAQADFQKLSGAPDYAGIVQAVRLCHFTPEDGFYPVWPPKHAPAKPPAGANGPFSLRNGLR